MNSQEVFYALALLFLKGVGTFKAKQIIEQFEKPSHFFSDPSSITILNQKGIRITKAEIKKALVKAEKEITYIQKENISTHYFLDKNYPFRLSQCPDCPILLFSKGGFNINPEKTLAIVGTRNISSLGVQIVKDLIDSIRNQNIQVVSGLAYGVDFLAHDLCVQSDIETIGVLGHGLDLIYPKVHEYLAEKMCASMGGIITEFPTGTIPNRFNFPRRNRIIAGMTDSTIIVESGVKGGSIITANFANDYARDVFAFPGGVFQESFRGCNSLIQSNKAHLVCSGDDVLNMLGWRKISEAPRLSQVKILSEEKTILSLIKDNPDLTIDGLVNQTRKSLSEIKSMLLTLELNGLLSSLPGNKFQINSSLLVGQL